MSERGVPGAPPLPEQEAEEEEVLGRGRGPGQEAGWPPPGQEAPAVGECGGSTLTTPPASR